MGSFSPLPASSSIDEQLGLCVVFKTKTVGLFFVFLSKKYSTGSQQEDQTLKLVIVSESMPSASLGVTLQK